MKKKDGDREVCMASVIVKQASRQLYSGVLERCDLGY